MKGFLSVFKRELKSYFSTPLAYVFLVIFLIISGFLPFRAGFFEMRQASLLLFFDNMPLLFIFLVPAMAMRLWAEERKSNTIELLFTLPVTVTQAVLAKFFAAWAVLALALALTCPMVFTVCYLGKPDSGPIITGYIGSLLLAGAYLAIGSFFSSLSRNQVIAFVLAVVACAVLFFLGSPAVMDTLSTLWFVPVGLVAALETLSFRLRFESLQRGVIQLHDIVFFLLLAAGWLWATMIALREKDNAERVIAGLRIAAAVSCIIIITACATLIVQKSAGRAGLDLTEDRLYTLSDGTRNILGELNQPVTLKLYYSRKAAMKGSEQIRFYSTYYLYVRAMLEEYVSVSNGKLSLEIIDPLRWSDEEDDAIQHDLRRYAMDGDKNFFFGLVAQTELGKAASISFFEPNRQEFIEYDVSKLITGVVRREKRTVGLLSSLPVSGANLSPELAYMMQIQGRRPPPPWIIVQQLREAYDIVPVEADADAIQDDIDFLMVVHPKQLPEKTLFAIDQFVMRGGKLIVFVDPHCLVDQPAAPRNPYMPSRHKADSSLNRLLKGWGVEMQSGVIAAARSAAASFPGSNARLSTFLALDQRCVNADEVVTAKLHNVQVFFPGVLKKVEGATATVTPLLSTTDRGGTWTPKSLRQLQRPDMRQINRDVEPAGEPVMIACRISGKLKTNFPDGIKIVEDVKKEPGDEKEDAKKPPLVKESPGDATVLVFADVDMVSDTVHYQRDSNGMTTAGDNIAVVFNALDFLAGSRDLIAIRSRGDFKRPFIVIDEIEARAEKATAKETEAINVKIADFKEKLMALGATANVENFKLVQSKVITEGKKLKEDIRTAEKEQRSLGASARVKIEDIKFWLIFHNVLWAPAAVLAIAIALAVARSTRARRYAARRM